MNTAEKLRKTAKELRNKARREKTVKCAQIADAMVALSLLKQRLEKQEM